MTQARDDGSTRPERPLFKIASRLRPSVPAGGAIPPASRKVGARSISETRSSTTRPPGAPGQAAMSAAAAPKS
jgi:hypothetical protein